MVCNMVYVMLLVVVAATAVSAQTYCSLCSDHTLCIYPGVGPECAPRLSGGVDAASKATILDIHNKYRQRVANGEVKEGSPGPQPEAANMRTMVWNDEIAAIAQRWVDQCTFGHDSCRKVSQFSVGQNVHMSSTTGTPSSPDWTSAIADLFSEVNDFNPAWISPFKYNDDIGHYSQLVWADTYSVGCGYTVFKSTDDPAWTNQYYVCNYGPAGNMKDGTMYKTGKPCSQCSGSCSTKYPGLCA